MSSDAAPQMKGDLIMARVLICASKGTSIGDWETMKRIAGTIERDARDYVWQVYVPCPNTFEIDRCRTSDFGIHKPGYGLGYYATIRTTSRRQRLLCQIEKHIVKIRYDFNGRISLTYK